MCIEFLLVTDLDHTLVGDPKATAVLNHRLQSNRTKVCLVYATGRSYASGCELKHTEGLLEPDYWVTAVGSEIYVQNIRDQAWAEHLSVNWQRADIAALAQTFTELEVQTAAEQNPWKISYWLAPDAPRNVIDKLRHKLAERNLAAQVIFSGDRDVDILPLNSNKGNAVKYLQTRLQVPAMSTLVCGDSGNDVSMFQQSARGVIVGNAMPELLDWYRNHGQPHHYLAQVNCAAGIMEAIDYFGFLALTENV